MGTKRSIKKGEGMVKIASSSSGTMSTKVLTSWEMLTDHAEMMGRSCRAAFRVTQFIFDN